MNLSELIDTCVAITMRPEKADLIKKYLNMGSAYTASQGTFQEALIPATVLVSTPGVYEGEISLSTLTRFRSMDTVKPYGASYYLAPVSPSKIFRDGCKAPNTYYIAGNTLNFSCVSPVEYLELLYYSTPPTLVQAADTHWLSEGYPTLLIDYACWRVFEATGYREEANMHKRAYMEAMIPLIQNRFGVNHHA